MNFFRFLHRKQVIHRKRKKEVRGKEPNGRTVPPTQLILTSIEQEFRALQNYRVFFEPYSSFRVINFSRKIYFYLKNWSSRPRIFFFRIRKLKKKLSIAL